MPEDSNQNILARLEALQAENARLKSQVENPEDAEERPTQADLNRFFQPRGPSSPLIRLKLPPPLEHPLGRRPTRGTPSAAASKEIL